jgi:hypothetical protein
MPSHKRGDFEPQMKYGWNTDGGKERETEFTELTEFLPQRMERAQKGQGP